MHDCSWAWSKARQDTTGLFAMAVTTSNWHTPPGAEPIQHVGRAPPLSEQRRAPLAPASNAIAHVTELSLEGVPVHEVQITAGDFLLHSDVVGHTSQAGPVLAELRMLMKTLEHLPPGPFEHAVGHEPAVDAHLREQRDSGGACRSEQLLRSFEGFEVTTQ